jgi:dihydroneopterin aldolase
MWVVKIGGSLASSPELSSWLAAVAGPAKLPLVVVPGGGHFADAVRRAQHLHGFDDVAAHRMALLAMEQFGLMLCALDSRLVPAASPEAIADAHRRGGVPVWMAAAMAADRPEIAASWDVTSDSLSVWLAAALGADTLLLVKSAEPPRAAKPISAEQLARLGLVDAAFPAMLRGRPVTVRILGPRDREALIRGLAEGVPPGVAVAP